MAVVLEVVRAVAEIVEEVVAEVVVGSSSTVINGCCGDAGSSSGGCRKYKANSFLKMFIIQRKGQHPYLYRYSCQYT